MLKITVRPLRIVVRRPKQVTARRSTWLNMRSVLGRKRS